MTADDAMAQAATYGDDRNERHEAGDWLRDVLADGPVAAKELQRMAADSGLAWPNVKRAKSELGVVSQRHGFGKGSTCSWAMPEATDDTNGSIGRIGTTPLVLNSMAPMAGDKVQTWSA
jgi:hypothetical protein